MSRPARRASFCGVRYSPGSYPAPLRWGGASKPQAGIPSEARSRTAMTILLVAGSVLAVIVGVAMSLRAGSLTTEMIEELNAESARAQKICIR